MKSVFYNPEKAEEEKKMSEKERLEAQRRKAYFERLGKDQRFKKYVLEEIIDAEIKANTDLSGSLATLIGSTPEAVKDIIIAKAAGKASAENIKNKITRNF